MTKLEEFKKSPFKCSFPANLVFEWIKCGKINLFEFNEYMHSVNFHRMLK